ncbi:unnamed protein product [Cylindrotheca closterium]|uniref:ABC transporter domain-containing protein n=1 Tax=Cylindrotheca closterium TaxID=2856 RepID=A0AAD2G1R0_9STRA|nr:unnamed protein product [Cylindrotheca closterium]
MEQPRAENNDRHNHEDPDTVRNLPNLKTVSWMKQFTWTVWKNKIILTRRPIPLIFLLISGILSALLSWSVGQDADDVIYPTFSECGTWDPGFAGTVQNMDWEERDKIQLSMNDQWRSGLPVALMMLGPCLNAIISFVFVHNEIHSQLFGVLRSLGLRDSVYWASWYVPFTIIACINSLLAAVTCQFLPGNVYESVYFGGVFTSMFLLQLALIPSVFLLAALCGTKRKAVANFTIFLLLCSAWVPFMVQSAQSMPPSALDYMWKNEMPKGLFWYYTSTLDIRQDYSWQENYNWTEHFEDPFSTYPPAQYDACNTPVLSEYQGTNPKPENGEERDNVQPEEIFVGCYSAASWSVKIWHDDDMITRIAMFFFPYFHFQNVWGHFVGYTSLPDNKFTAAETSLSAGELAIKALPTSNINPLLAFDSKLAPQGSTFVLGRYDVYNYDWKNPTTVCPAANPSTGNYGFCGDSYGNCMYVKDPGPMQSTPTTNDIFGYLILLCVMYLLLAAYFAQVLPGMNGRGEPFYFPFLPSYWFGKRGKKDDNDDGDDEHNESEVGVGVHIDNVKKKYGSFEALKGVSFHMAAGEVTALLGHNGAGKTTLSNILCCNIGSTSGNIRVFGQDIGEDPFAIRQMVGLCKQDDYLWPTLSAREHLELFAGLRGITKEKLEATVSVWLRSVDLEEVQLQYASAYSGGMKRRLSLALATIGDRPLIILDEPTTGMDPVSRRFVWRHIDQIKDGRVILLTTHAMEEADLLADEVAIIRDGELAAFGSPLQLKAEHGTALQFSLLLDQDKVKDAAAYIETFFSATKESVQVDSSNPGSITVKILNMADGEESDGVNAHTLSDFVTWLDSAESSVKEYGFSNSSLEEVFLAVTGTHSQSTETETSAGDDEGNTVIVPDVEEGEANDIDIQPPMTTFEPKISFGNQTITIFMDMWTRSWGRGAFINYIIYGIFVAGCLLTGFGVANDYDPTSLFGVVVLLASLILTSIIGPVYSDKAEGLFYLMQSQGLLSRAYVAGISLYGFSVYLVYGLIILGGFYGTSMFREPIECPYGEDEWGYYRDICEVNDWEKPWGSVPNQNLLRLSFEDQYDEQYVSLRVSRSPGGFGMIVAIIFCFALTGVGAVLTTAFLPGYRIPLVSVMLFILVSSFWPTIDARVLSEYDYRICENMTDPELVCQSTLYPNNTAEEILNCAGLQISSSGIGHYCMDPAASLLPQISLLQSLIMAYYSRVTLVSQPEKYVEQVLIPSFEGVSCDGNTCEFPLANQIFRENMLFMFLGAIILLVLGIFLTCLLAFPFGPFVYIRRLFRSITDAVLCKNTKSTTMPNNSGDKDDAGLEEVTQERQTVTSLCQEFVSGEGTQSSPLKIDMNKVSRNDVPPVVTRGLRKVYPALGGRPPKVALRDLDLHVPKGQTLGLLGKNGAGKTTALKILAGAHESTSGVGMVVGYNCNTDKLNIFERLGNCAQFDVVWKKRSVRYHLEFFAMLKGVPRSKATEVARNAATAVGLKSLEMFHRKAGDLSGGMRRRLSIAISLIGSPKVNILDEPTTGLDPSTRNSIWKLIKSFSSTDRSTIITTHMMIEADTLCDRIAIVKDGALKVIGTQQHLKDNFGSGYNLQLNLVKSTEEYQEKAMSFVRQNVHAQAVLALRQAKTLHVSLPRDLRLERVFRALYSKERETEGGINQFLLSQSSLEDVFVRMSE